MFIIYIYIHIFRYSCIIHINLDLYLSIYIFIYLFNHMHFFFRNPSLPSLFVSQNPRFLSSSKVQVLHELPSAEDFFKTYVLTGTPVEPWLHITLVMTRNTQLINTNIGNFGDAVFCWNLWENIDKSRSWLRGSIVHIDFKKTVLRDRCFFTAAWDFVCCSFFFSPSTESGDEGDSWCLPCWTFSACRDITRLCVFEKKM